MKIYIVVAAVISLTGCVSNTVLDLKSEKESLDGIISIDKSYQTTYRNLRNMSRNCLEQSPLGTPVIVEAENDADIKEGQIRQKMVAQGVLLNLAVIDIRSVQDSTTEVALYTIKDWRSIGVSIPVLKDIERWAKDDKICWIDDKRSVGGAL